MPTDPTTEQSFIAYELHPQSDYQLEAAPINREWMDKAHLRFPYRCLPLTIANQAGPNQRTPNLASILQEIMNRPGWSPGNAIVLVITGTGSRNAAAFDDSHRDSRAWSWGSVNGLLRNSSIPAA